MFLSYTFGVGKCFLNYDSAQIYIVCGMQPSHRYSFKASETAIIDVKERSHRGLQNITKVSKLLAKAISRYGAYCSFALILNNESSSWHAAGFVSVTDDDENLCIKELTNQRHFHDSSLNNPFSIGSIIQCFCHDIVVMNVRNQHCRLAHNTIGIVSNKFSFSYNAVSAVYIFLY